MYVPKSKREQKMEKTVLEKTLKVPFEAYKVSKKGYRPMRVTVDFGILSSKRALRRAIREEKPIDFEEVLNEYFTFRLAKACGIDALPLIIETQEP